MPIDRFLLSGSEREPRADARVTGTPNPAETIEVSLLLRRGAAPDLAAAHDEPITREEFAIRYAASSDDIERIEAFAQQFELTIVGVDLPRRTITLAGTIASLNEAFGTTLKLYDAIAAGVARSICLPI
jgi:kumamolisin